MAISTSKGNININKNINNNDKLKYASYYHLERIRDNINKFNN